MPIAKPRALLAAVALFAPLALLTFGAPAAVALPDSPHTVTISYALTPEAPTVVALGRVHVEATARGVVFATGIRSAVLTDVPRLRVDDVDERGEARTREYTDVDVELVGGGFHMSPDPASGARVSGAVVSGAGILLPPDQGNGTTAVLAAEQVEASITHAATGESEFLPTSALVTLRDETGTPLPGWDGVRVNENLQPGVLPSRKPLDVTVFTLEGAFKTRVQGEAVGLTLGTTKEAQDLIVTVTPGAVGKFNATMRALDALAPTVGAPVPQDFLTGVEPIAPVLNGAVVLVQGAQTATTLQGDFGALKRDLGPFSLLRARDIAISLATPGEVRITGAAYLSFTGNEFTTAARTTVAPAFPVTAVVLWAIALACLVAWVVKRPPEGGPKGPRAIRLSVFGAHLLILLVVFYLFDVAFADAFGTSALTSLMQEPFSLSTFLTITGLQMVPWTLGVLCFAVPTRIASGILLRYAGVGVTYKGFAKAAGLVALGVFAPGHALFFLNETLLQFLPSAIGA